MVLKERLEAISVLRNDIVLMSRRLKQSSGADSETWTGLMILGAIERADGAATPGHIASELELQSSNLANILSSLEGRGLIARTPDPQDKRRVRLSITGKGLQLTRTTRAQRTKWLAEAMDDALTVHEQDMLMAMMRRLALSSQSAPQDR